MWESQNKQHKDCIWQYQVLLVSRLYRYRVR